MNIYQSTEVRPYIYICTHKTTGEFYIGYREANKVISQLDFPKYKTSSKIINPNFNDYFWIIYAEFSNGLDAYDYEQQLIFENWNNPLLLNKVCYHNKKRFRCISISTVHQEQVRRHALIRINNGTHNFQRRPDGTSLASDRVAKGIHAGQTRPNGTSIASDRVANGTHNLVGANNPSHNRISKGIHNFIGDTNPNKNMPRVTCPHCNKTGGRNQMKRYHFQNCKFH